MVSGFFSPQAWKFPTKPPKQEIFTCFFLSFFFRILFIYVLNFFVCFRLFCGAFLEARRKTKRICITKWTGTSGGIGWGGSQTGGKRERETGWQTDGEQLLFLAHNKGTGVGDWNGDRDGAATVWWKREGLMFTRQVNAPQINNN